MEITRAKINNFDEVYQLICELQDEPVNQDELFQVYEKNIMNPDIYYFLASDGLQTVGFASVHIQFLLHHAARIAELQEIIVCKSKQGMGIGQLLFIQAKETARDIGCLQLEVCCSQIRKESHKFYLKQGMKNSHFKFTLSLGNPAI